jgi:membrane-bound lytic murein transglycosylase D
MKIKILLLFVVFISCQTSKNITIEEKGKNIIELPDNLWLSTLAQMRIDSIFNLKTQALDYLINQDTLGAELAFEYIFEIQSRFTGEEQETLSGWEKYDSTIQIINESYEQIFIKNDELVEAEEIREEITDMEESLFADSVLFGHGTVVDSSGKMPITLNERVRAAIKYFQTKGRGVFNRWLERSGKYEQMIKGVLKEYDLPEELTYLAMIESGFNPHARSYARAAGMWQFISATGKYYGLNHNWWYDDRQDFLKATRAAAEHLRDLNIRFNGDWYLSLAGYNCNPKRVERNMRTYNTTDFWKLRGLPRQTRNYVPTFLAAAIIAKDPVKFGFYIDKQAPLEVDTVLISESIDLNVIAQSVDTSYSYIKEINPAILRWVTPPGVKDFALYLPKGKKEAFKKVYTEMPDEQKRSWVRHQIRSGESLSSIANKYNTNISVLKSTNKLRGNTIRAGHYLLIPVPQNKKHYYASNNAYSSSPKKRNQASKPIVSKENNTEFTYIVKKGDTLGEIAERFSTRAAKIRSWNGLYYGQHIYPNQVLTIYIPKSGTPLLANTSPVADPEAVYYTVRAGDTLWEISKKYNISISNLKKLNNKNSSKIRPGELLIVNEK